MRFVLATAAAAVLMSACATAPAAETKLASNDGDASRQICRSVNQTGSNRVIKMCTSPRQWQNLDQKVKDEQNNQNDKAEKDLDRMRAPNISPNIQ